MLIFTAPCCSVEAGSESAITFGRVLSQKGNVFSLVPGGKEIWSTGM